MKRKMCAALAAAVLALAGCFTSIADDDLAAGGGNEAQMPNDTDDNSGQGITYTVTFDSRNGSAVAPQRVERGQTATPVTDPTKEGYKFLGWYLDGEEFNFAMPITADITLTAQWLIHGTYDYLTIENGVVTGYASDISGDITIPEGVTGIGYAAFFNCHSLVSVTIPDSVTSIGNWAFYGCYSLASVTIPDSVTSIGNRAFSDCSSLASITIPGSVTSIGDWTFSWCERLTSITIPDSVTSIGDYAFFDCKELKNVYYGGSGAAWEELMRNTGTDNDLLKNATIHYISTGA